MWNNLAPLELLKKMPAQFDADNLKNIQQIIDVDKYLNSMRLWYDLCGTYAPFCKYCDKCGNTPCAVAYVKFKQAENYESEIAITSDEEYQDEQKPKAKKSVRVAIARKKQQ